MKGKIIIKTIIYRVGSLVLSFILLYIFTGNITFSGQLSVVQMLASTVFYYCYEKVWENDGWLKKLFVRWNYGRTVQTKK